LVALGLGLTMMIREFDLSVVGMYSMAGCIAVVMGGTNAWLGLACALAAGLAAGLAQGWLIVRLRLGSVGVTLGGLLVFAGIAYVVTENRALPYENMEVALGLSAPIGGIFSIRSIVAIAIFAAAALVISLTRYGRDIIAIGSDRRAAMTAGVNVDALVIGIFGFSGFCAALSGALLSYSLASASPAGLSDVIVPAAAAAILGGVSLAGGTGRPLGIAMGVLSLAVLRAGFNAVGALRQRGRDGHHSPAGGGARQHVSRTASARARAARALTGASNAPQCGSTDGTIRCWSGLRSRRARPAIASRGPARSGP
jgi:ribose/xylose/arabinose/galactoside ABC-type transport system permease subunit